MRCPIETQENAELLLSYSARRLSPENAALLEAHMEACPACREFRDSQAALWEALDGWEARPVSLDFDRRLYRRIEEQERQSWWTRLFGSERPMFLRPALPLAATACLVLAAGFIIDNPGRILPGVEAPKVQEVEQLERTLDDMEMLRQFNLIAPAAEEKESSRSM
jgi:anti-sigma factor RsiW